MSVLVTGGLGIIGAEVTHQLVERGQTVVVFDVATNIDRVKAIRDRIHIVHGDLANMIALSDAIRSHHITHIYHFGALLGFVSEEAPWRSFAANVLGTQNILEASRLFGVQQIIFASSTGTYGSGPQSPLIADDSPQRPGILYGWEKLYSEGSGAWYRQKYGIDFRGLRYAQIVGPNAVLPWVWAPAMIQDAILGRPHNASFATRASIQSLTYIRDAARAAIELAAAPASAVKTITYNVVGPAEMTSAAELEHALIKRFPNFRVTYARDEQPSDPATRIRYVDHNARTDWNWRPEYTSVDTVIAAFAADLKTSPQRFGLLDARSKS